MPGARSRDKHLELQRGTRTLGTAATLQSPAAVMDPEMVQVTIGGQGDLSPAATLTTATAGQQPTYKYFLEPINTLQLYPKPLKTTAADARRKAWK